MNKTALLEQIRGAMKAPVEALKEFKGLVRIISHYDPDGISAAGIVARALLQEGKRFRLSFIKGISPDVFNGLEHEGFVIILDMGSGQLETIRDLGAVVVICDHHISPEIREYLGSGIAEDSSNGNGGSRNGFQPLETEKGVIYEFNCHRFGIDGGYAACASSMAYAYVTAISRMNSPLSSLAAAGIYGDRQSHPLQGLNEEVVGEGKAQGYIQEKKGALFLDGENLRSALIQSVDPYFPGLTGRESTVDTFLMDCRIDGSKSIDSLTLDEKRYLTDKLMLILLKNDSPPEAIKRIVGTRYFLSEFDIYADTLSNRLNACGRLDWMTTGLGVCLGEGKAMEKAIRLRKKYRSTIRNGLVYLESRGIKKLDHIQYFFNNDPSSSGTFAGLGIQFLFDRNSPIIALSKNDDEITVSSRGTRELVDKGLDLSTAMRDAAFTVGGNGGGHPVASGATIPDGKEDEFLRIVDGIVASQMKRVDE